MSWVSNICQKFEAACRELDDIVNHDSIKYIEKQVQNVGENVMELYSKLVQVLATPIVDDVDPVSNEAEMVNQQENIAVSSYFKSMLGIGEDSADTVDVQSTVEHAAFEPVKNPSVHGSSDLERINEQVFPVFEGFLEETESKLVGSDSSGNENAIMESVGFLTEAASDSFEVNTGYVSCASSASYASGASSEALDDVASSVISCNETIAEMGSESEFSSNTLPNDACTKYTNAPKNSSSVIVLHNDVIGTIEQESDDFGSQIDSHGNKVVERKPVSCSSSIAPSMESFGSSDNCNCKTTDFDKEATNLSCQVELDENCVLIDCSTPHHGVSYEAQNQCSYKKKILDALSSKKRLAREYEELAILHGNSATKSCQGRSLPAPPTMLLRNSQTVSLSDSDWELL